MIIRKSAQEIDTMRQMESQMMMRSYEGFLK